VCLSVAENPVLHYVVYYNGHECVMIVMVAGSYGRHWRGAPKAAPAVIVRENIVLF
jgi:hypothetical protein